MRRLALFPLALAGALLAQPAFAQSSTSGDEDHGRFYIGGFVGARFGDDQTFRGATVAGDPRKIETTSDADVMGGVVLGAVAAQGDWGRARVEGELGASRNSLKRLKLNGTGRELLEGRTSITTTMVNLIYDTPKVGNLVRFSAGGGVGMAGVDYDIRYKVAAAGPAITIPTSASGHLAFQAIGGASIALGKRVELTADVRYLHVTGHQVERFNATAGTLDSVLQTRSHNLAATAGFRFFL